MVLLRQITILMLAPICHQPTRIRAGELFPQIQTLVHITFCWVWVTDSSPNESTKKVNPH
jgi:hypothetical protein